MIEATPAAARAHPASGAIECAKTMHGQCQRYQLYEMSPTNRIGRVPSRWLTGFVDTFPAATNSAVPTTGSNAAAPGKTVASL